MRRALVIMCVVVGMSLPAGSQNPENAARNQTEQESHVLGGDRFATGDNVSVNQPVEGDLIAAGRDVAIASDVSGDAVAAGRSVSFSGSTDQNVYAAGREVSISGVVGQNARLAGGQVEITPSSQVYGGVSIGARQARVSGDINGYLQAAARDLYINGPIDGNVEVSAGQLRLGPNARIAGSLRYRSNSDLYRDSAAQVLGQIERLPAPRTSMGFMRALFWIGTIGLMIMVVIVAIAWPRFFSGVDQTMLARPGASVLWGLATLILIPVVATILFVTLVGAPLAVLALAAYVMLLLLGYAATGAAIGDWIWRRFRPQAARGIGHQIWTAIVGLILVALVAQIPVLGALVIFAVLVFGMGAVTAYIRQVMRPPLPASAQAG